MNTPVPHRLYDLARRQLDAHGMADGKLATPIPGLSIVREIQPSPLTHDIPAPMVALVLQGEKQVTAGSRTTHLKPGDSLLIAADVPTISQVMRASADKPYVSIIIDLNPAVIEPLLLEIDGLPDGGHAVRSQTTTPDMADAARRLLELLDRPAALPILQEGLIRELHFWLLSGAHGAGIRHLGMTHSHHHRIARTVSLIRSRYNQTLRIEQLAETAGMSPSAFHQHFKQITTLTPLQFQKQLRLIEARQKLLTRGASIADTAYGVGYESIPQFTRDYARMFGAPPAKDRRAQAQIA